ncbi:alpha-(1,3)-fucosyltransferase C [Daphnia magna]|uniref:alpha-(1,3)-fucosyltransferase C n=1 Tax=Daphnia magna TaxID=35525 RepID=UPI001E1BC19E|nr:alpha-(1,3)-fucosyltransferase C [Daphnia magna]
MIKRTSALSKLNYRKVFLYFLLFQVVCIVVFLLQQNLIFNPQRIYRVLLKIIKRNDNKTILIWNSPNRIETAAFGLGHEPFVQHGCEVSTCVVFDNTSSVLPLEDYDAIIVNIQELWKTGMPSFNRRKHQRLVFLTQESPTTLPYIQYHLVGNLFNWTMSYKLNSDVLLLYGRIRPGPKAPNTLADTHKMMEEMHLPPARNYAANKTRQVVWMASHCNTKSLRETYVRELSKFISVDVYGGCGNFSCDRNGTHWLSHPKCYDKLEGEYKFYLSFENSICTDYATEKFFEIMKRRIIPVVYGGANYSVLAPHHSYINVLDFETPEKLAQYLRFLDENDMFYNEYFWWKEHYQVEAGVDQMARHGFCDLCKKLHQDEDISKYYPELISEWHPSTQCKYFGSWERTMTTTSTTQSSSTTQSITTSSIATNSPNSTNVTGVQNSPRLHKKLLGYVMQRLLP